MLAQPNWNVWRSIESVQPVKVNCRLKVSWSYFSLVRWTRWILLKLENRRYESDVKGRIVFGLCSSSSFSDVSHQCQPCTVSQLSSVFHTELSGIVTDLSRRTTQSPASLSLPANAKGCLKNKSNTKKCRRWIQYFWWRGGGYTGCQKMCAWKLDCFQAAIEGEKNKTERPRQWRK